MNKTPYIIEINTIQGLSEESIIPKQVKELGISLTQLLIIVLNQLLNKYLYLQSNKIYNERENK